MKLIKFQLGGKNLPLTDVLKFQLNQVNPLTGKKPEIRGWEINNGELDVVTAESGTKLESKEATPFMNFFKFLIPGFKLAYDQKLALKNYDAKMKALYRVRIPLQEPPESIYKPKVQLAKKSLTTIALNKPITKHLFGTTKEGILYRGSNKSNRFVALSVNSIPEVNVKGIDRRWRFDTRETNHDNGYGVKSLTFFDYYDGGNSYLGDLAPIRGGRTIYMSPKGNDTLYWNKPSKWINFQHGFMPVGGNQPGAKANFFKNLKRPLIKTLQKGGPIERTDNTRVASGRPQQVLNKIPWGAGKGPAGEGPMRLFNDPYVNMGLMAMGPMVGKFKPGETPFHANGVKYAPPTLQDIINYIKLLPKAPDNARAMGLGVHRLSRMSGKSPLEVIKIMSLKFGDPQTYPKAFNNSEPAYGWTFENPDLYRLALLLFNLK